MPTGFRLALLVGLSGALLLLLGCAAHSAADGLLEVPPQSWGMGHLSDAVVAGTCTIGALGALWHAVSAVLALVALRDSHDRRFSRSGGVPGLAVRILEGWGAPAVRRIAASALVVSLSSTPALAAEGAAGGDDLGWRPTSSAPASPVQSASPQAGQSPSGSADAGDPPSIAAPDGARSRIDGPAPSSSPAPSDRAGESGDPVGSAPPATTDDRASTTSGPEASERTHTVLPGESLWSITASLLPSGAGAARIARSWPALYRANADVIGADPSLIRPGTVLTVPGSLAAPSTTTGGQNPSR